MTSISRFLGPEISLSAQAPEDMMMSSHALGGTFLLDSLWRKLGVRKTLIGLLSLRGLPSGAREVDLSLVANRALCLSSKLSACKWAPIEAVTEGLDRL